MPSLLNRLTGTASYPIVLAQYKNEFRGVGHEPALHWVLVVITDKATLSGPSFQAYAQTSRARRPRPRRPRLSDSSDATASSSGSRRSTSAVVTMGTLALDGPAAPGATDTQQETKEVEAETDVQWYTRHGKASLFDVCATVRTLCLGGVQVGGSRYGGTSKGTPASPHWLICIVGPHAWTRPSHRRKGAIVATELSCRGREVRAFAGWPLGTRVCVPAGRGDGGTEKGTKRLREGQSGGAYIRAGEEALQPARAGHRRPRQGRFVLPRAAEASWVHGPKAVQGTRRDARSFEDAQGPRAVSCSVM